MASGIDNSGEDGAPARVRPQPLAPVPVPEPHPGIRAGLEELGGPSVLIGSVALTFFSAIALACAAGLAAGLVGLLGRVPDTSDALVRIIDSVTPAGAADAASGAADDLVRHKGIAFGLSTLALLATAAAGAAYLRTFRWTLAVASPRQAAAGGVWIVALPVVLVATLLGCAVAAMVLLTGPVAQAVADGAGLGDRAVDLWSIFKWPVAAATYLLLLAALSAQIRADRLGESAWAATARWGVLLVWIITLAGFAYYVADFGSFSGNYGGGWAAALSLLWIALFVMLGLAMPLRPSGSLRPLVIGSLIALALWLPASVLMALLVSNLGPLSGVLAAMALVTATPLWLWACNAGLLAGAAVRRHLDLGVPAPAGSAEPRAAPAAPASAAFTPGPELAGAVAAALADDAAQRGVLSVMPPGPGTPPGGLLTELERDIADWGFTYGVAWAHTRARYPDEPEEVVAQRALTVAGEVFGQYMDDPEWAKRIERQRRGERAAAGSDNGHARIGGPLPGRPGR